MSDQKSLPRRGRQRYHQQHPSYTTNTTPRHKPALTQQNTNSNNTNLNTNTSPRSSNKIPRMPSQFRPIQNRTNTPSRHSPSC